MTASLDYENCGPGLRSVAYTAKPYYACPSRKNQFEWAEFWRKMDTETVVGKQYTKKQTAQNVGVTNHRVAMSLATSAT